ncbi:hypothetical protein Pmani_007453 [Petrolisthes manimaculis]|uniref:Alkylglycerol monooxygenase n=1 Tax=Petrolisthes manimaculis TaxID=1843537 RepID=A0AAE1Q8G5_9EUCA|nr:hypothetical protein Pmani_007453 [Petrolisthes manimaculis]
MASSSTTTTTWALERLGMFFYVASPNATTFHDTQDVPDYVQEVVPLFITFLVVEWLVQWLKGEQKRVRHNDFITSLMHGMVYDVFGVIVSSFTLYGYDWLYQHRLLDFDWTSSLTWWIAAVGVDFGYYWFHRATHEVNLIWASHQVHHSSEDYNLSTALRQSMFQRYFSLGVYQPLALLGVPPAALLVHLQFNLIYQFWIHTELVDRCGPLEWVLNTPSHHRVHHGSNKWCLDKNYAGVLIVWDRLFGTFQEERDNEPIAYGLVDQPQSLNVMWLQVFYFRAVYSKARSMTTWGDTFRALFYGPGWFPGTPRLGDLDTFPDVKAPRVKYDPQLPQWMEIYILLHFLILLLIQQHWITELKVFPWVSSLAFTLFVFVSTGTIGAMYDGWWWAPLLETTRCLAYVAYARAHPVLANPFLDFVVLTYFTVSSVVWCSQSMAVLQATLKHHKLE